MQTSLSTTATARVRRLGNANHVIFSDVEDEDTRSTHEQPAELHDAPFGSDGVYYTGEQWDQYEKNFERDEDGVQNAKSECTYPS